MVKQLEDRGKALSLLPAAYRNSGCRHGFREQSNLSIFSCNNSLEPGDVGVYDRESTVVGLLRICAKQKDLRKGTKVHADVIKTGWLDKSSYVASSIVSMYAKCGTLQKAQQVLHELPMRNIVAWNALIAGYARQGKSEEALRCIDQMRHDGISPDAVTFTCALRVCGRMRDADRGEKFYEEIVKQRLLEKDVVLGNALVDMFVKCGVLAKAQRALNELPIRNVISWTALIAGYVRYGKGEEALSCMDYMQHDGLSPNAVTFICALQACGLVGASDKGKQIHKEIVKQELLKKDLLLGTALVDMYAKCGILGKAKQVLSELVIRDVVAWNALIAGYAHQGKIGKVMSCLNQMQRDGLSPDAATFVCALRACRSIGAIKEGKQIHEEVSKRGLVEKEVVLGNALVDMYARCGELRKAQQLLHELPVRDVSSWTALIAGYARQGKNKEALACFDQMQREGHSPDASTFVCVLNACTHSGLLAKAQTYFAEMSSKYGITPEIEHHGCIIDLFGRAGELHKALALFANIPPGDHLYVWLVLLGACQKWKNVEVGKLAFENAVQIDKRNATAYVLMSNLFVAIDMHKAANEIEVMRIRNEAWKQPGCTQ